MIRVVDRDEISTSRLAQRSARWQDRFWNGYIISRFRTPSQARGDHIMKKQFTLPATPLLNGLARSSMTFFTKSISHLDQKSGLQKNSTHPARACLRPASLAPSPSPYWNRGVVARSVAAIGSRSNRKIVLLLQLWLIAPPERSH
jgi:hypothetical protein